MTVPIALHAKVEPRVDAPSMLFRLHDGIAEIQETEAHLMKVDGLATTLVLPHEVRSELGRPSASSIPLPRELAHLSHGDIVRWNPRHGDMWVMYRRASGSNAIFTTERCNSYCIMCSQPPRAVNDSYLVDQWLRAIPLMSPDTQCLGLTGGEPTLLGERLLELFACCKAYLPNTALHLLSNGRNFRYLSFARALADIGNRDVMVGIPLYSDIAWRHEFVVQAAGSFDETIRGILNLARCRVPVEVRVVVHKATVGRLVQLADFIARNLPFVSQVVWMGLEPTGFGKTNFDALWIEPAKYQDELESAVQRLNESAIRTMIYNHPLCVLRETLRPHAAKSISDWKNIYLPQCDGCDLRSDCGGLFYSSLKKHSREIRPIIRCKSIV